MRAKALFSILTAIFFNACIGMAFAAFTGFNPLACVSGANLIGLTIGLKAASPVTGLAFNAILRQISLAEIRTAFYADGAWLTRARNMDSYVNANTIDLADAGVDPEVLINNTTYPIEITERPDGNLEYTLDTLDTVNTKVGSIEQLLAAYDKRQDVIRSHRQSLLTTSLRLAAHAYAPNSNTADTPVLATTGSSTSIGGNNYKAISFDDIITMRGTFADKNFLSKGGNMICLLNPKHTMQLMKEDKDLYKKLLDINNYKPERFAGIEFYEYSDTPIYNKSTLVKKALKTAALGTDSPATSVFFVDTEVFRCDGTYKMFMTADSPEYRADIVGFQKRFLAAPFKQQAIGAIVTVDA